ncbi:hypothetical protein ABGB07_45295 [Micromonosporaceae bacterium B7E4]
MVTPDERQALLHLNRQRASYDLDPARLRALDASDPQRRPEVAQCRRDQNRRRCRQADQPAGQRGTADQRQLLHDAEPTIGRDQASAAGLVTRQRAGRLVFYARTLRGDALLGD